MRQVFPYKIKINPNTQASDIRIQIQGKSFLKTRSLYLSASNLEMFENIQEFNPFLDGSEKQIQLYPPFSALQVLEFTTIDERYIEFIFPEIPKSSGMVDIIAENEAGYGKLTDSRLPFLSSYEGAEDFQFPWVGGLQIEISD
jgi:hypothetical protein